jgi:hypothetical protein
MAADRDNVRAQDGRREERKVKPRLAWVVEKET